MKARVLLILTAVLTLGAFVGPASAQNIDPEAQVKLTLLTVRLDRLESSVGQMKSK